MKNYLILALTIISIFSFSKCITPNKSRYRHKTKVTIVKKPEHDVSKDDVAKHDVSKDDVAKHDVAKHDVAKHDAKEISQIKLVGYYKRPDKGKNSSTRDTAVIGNYLYVLAGDLKIYNNNPSLPEYIKSIDLGGGTFKIKVSGKYAYIGAGNTLVILDVSAPVSPKIIKKMKLNGEFYNIHLSGKYAYIIEHFRNEKSNLLIVDITKKKYPRIIGKFRSRGYGGIGLFSNVQVSGKYAYLTDGRPNNSSKNFLILNISRPSSPRLVCSVVDAKRHVRAVDIKVSGNYAYVGYNGSIDSSLKIFNISNPQAPKLTAIFDLKDNYIRAINIKDNYLYLSYTKESFNRKNKKYVRKKGVKIIDISNNSSPKEVANINTEDRVRQVYLSGDFAYISDNSAGVKIINVSNIKHPKLIGKVRTFIVAHKITVYGKYAYVAGRYEGIKIFDISNPLNPKLKKVFDTNGKTSNIIISGRYAYVSGAFQGLKIFDISRPLSPKHIGTYMSKGKISGGVYVKGNLFYASCGDAGMKILDVSNPSLPKLIGKIVLKGRVNDIYVSGKYAFVATSGGKGLFVVDVSNPSNPGVIKSIDTYKKKLSKSSYAIRDMNDLHHIVVSGNYAYLADGYEGLIIMNISNHSSPRFFKNFKVNLKDDLYMLSGNLFGIGMGMTVFDVSKPKTPKIIKKIKYDGSSGMNVSQNYIYTCGGYSKKKLKIYKITYK